MVLQAPQKIQKEAKKAVRGLPNPFAGTQKTPQKAVKKASKSLPSLPKNPFGGAKQAGKKVQKAAKKAPSRAKSAVAGGSKTKGWFGGEGGAQDLDKWYGESHLILSQYIQAPDYFLVQYLSGPHSSHGHWRSNLLPRW